MPSVLEQNAVYLQSGNPDTESDATLHAPGLIGARYTYTPSSRAAGAAAARTRGYQIVQIDPASGVANSKSGQPVYWVDRATYKVGLAGGTTLNQVAGVVNNVSPKGNYVHIQQKGPCLVRASDANVTAAVAGADNILGGATDLGVLLAAGTAVTTLPLGTVAAPKVTDLTGGTGNQKVLVDLTIDPAP